MDIDFGISGQMNFLLSLESVPEFDGVAEDHAGFPSTPTDPVMHLAVCLDDLAGAARPGPGIHAEGHVLYMDYPDIQAVINLGNWQGEVRLPPQSAKSNLYEVLRYLVSLRIFQTGGMSFHAAAVSDGACSHVLIGPSGVGKTTAAKKLSKHLTVISDEWVPIARTPEGFRLCRVPYWVGSGHMHHAGSAANVPISAIAMLRQGNKNAILRLSPAQAAMEICGLPNTPENLVSTDKVLETAAIMAGKLPVYMLESTKEGKLWPLLQAINMGKETRFGH